MRNFFRRHPDLVGISANECHALWFAFQTVREEFVMSFPIGAERETAERFGLGFHFANKESFVPTEKWNAFYIRLAELGIAALPSATNVRLLCCHFPDEHRSFLDSVVAKLGKK